MTKGARSFERVVKVIRPTMCRTHLEVCRGQTLLEPVSYRECPGKLTNGHRDRRLPKDTQPTNS